MQPNYGTVGISDDAKVEVTFSEPMKISSLTNTTFKLQNSGDNTAVAGDISLSNDGTVATLTPSSPLSPSTPFTATVSNSVKDLAGNKLVSAKIWIFTTGASNANDNANGQVMNPSSVNGQFVDIQSRVLPKMLGFYL